MSEIGVRSRIATIVAALVVVASAPPATLASPRASGRSGGWNSPAGARLDPSRRSVPPAVGRRLLVRFHGGVGGTRAAALFRTSGARLVDRIGLVGVDVVRVPPARSLGRALHRLRASPLVRTAARDHVVYPAVVPADDRFDEQWALHNTGQPHPVADGPEAVAGTAGADIDAPEAWDVTEGRAGTVIAVLDSGVDIAHADLDDNLWTSADTPDNGVDDDRNGYIDDVHGWDFARDVNDVFQDLPTVEGYDHGTHVAGIAAAEANGEGTVGVCPECSIMVLKFQRPFDTDADGTKDTMLGLASAELEALAYARRMGADIVNGSFGSVVWRGLERDAFRRLGGAGVVSVVSAGNSNGDNDMFLGRDFDGDGIFDSEAPTFPAAYDLNSIITVAASNHKDQYGYFTNCAVSRGGPAWPCAFTNWGHNSVEVAAPGTDILSTVPSGHDTFNGTSMAAPLVAGLAGLVRSHRPRLSVAGVRNAILNSTDKPASLNRLHAFPRGVRRGGGFTRTSGRVNALRALTASPRTRYGATDGTVRGARGIARQRRGSVSWPRDVNDVYKRKLARGRRYSVTLNSSRGDNLDLVVYKPGTKDVWQVQRGCFTGRGPCKLQAFPQTKRGDEAVRFRARRGGTYVIQVSAYFSSGRYTLRVVRG
jgi:subtilisin family serine protease